MTILGADTQAQIINGITQIKEIAEKAVRGSDAAREENEKLKARIDAMPGQAGLDQLRNDVEAKIEQSNHQRAQDLRERCDKLDNKLNTIDESLTALHRAMDNLSETFVPIEELPRRVNSISEDRETAQAEARQALNKERRSTFYMQLSIVSALMGVGSALFLAARYIWGLI